MWLSFGSLPSADFGFGGQGSKHGALLSSAVKVIFVDERNRPRINPAIVGRANQALSN